MPAYNQWSGTLKVKRLLFLGMGYLALAFGALGVVLPLLPTVPLLILAAYFFARSNPKLERRIAKHPRMRPHIEAWRQRGAISRRGKASALAAFALSATAGTLLVDLPWAIAPVLAALAGGSWIMSRPSA